MTTCITGRVCEKLTGHRGKDQSICGKCREVLKNDLARIVLEMNPIYLSEDNRYRKGKSSTITDKERHSIKTAHENGKTMRELVKEYKLSLGTIFNIINR